MADLNGFNALDIEPAQGREPVPNGKHKGHIVASETRPTKEGTGQYLWLEFEIIDGEHQGRKLFDRLHLANPKPQAVQIAEQRLSALCRAVNKLQPQDSEELHFIPLIAVVRVRPPRDGYDATNEIRGYEPLTGAAPATSKPAAAAPASGETPATTPAWRARQAG